MKAEQELYRIQQEELQILTEFADYCDQNGLRYCLAGGTLLGAVRHSGFIPWDDDIDVMMPRPDFNRFIELTNGSVNGKYEVLWDDKIENFPVPYMKVINRKVRVSYKIMKDKQSIWIDIFPIDGLPNDEKEFERHMRRMYRLKYYLWQATSRNQAIGSKFRRMIKQIVFLPLEMIGGLHFARRMTKLATKYSFEQCSQVGCVVGKYGRQERISKKCVEERTTMMFEGKQFYIPKGFKIYLTNLYGDYMKIPKDKHTHLAKRDSV